MGPDVEQRFSMTAIDAIRFAVIYTSDSVAAIAWYQRASNSTQQQPEQQQ